MGGAERAGKEKRKSDEAINSALCDLAEERRGPIFKFEGRKRCPACGQSDALVRTFCFGDDERLEHMKNRCRKVGEHTHVDCEVQKGGCGFGWRERVRDTEAFPNHAQVEADGD